MANELAVSNGWAAALNPVTSAETWKIAEAMAKSELVPKQYRGRPTDIILAGAMGHRLGLDIFSSLQGIAPINGRMTLWGDALLAVCQGRKDWRGMVVDWDKDVCTVTITRALADGSTTQGVGSFGDADAKAAGLSNKQGPWTTNPKRMKENRARAFAIRNAYSDAITGFAIREEVEDYTEIEATDITPKKRGRPSKFSAEFANEPTPETIPNEQQATAEPQETACAGTNTEVEKDNSQGQNTGETRTPGIEEVRKAVNRAAACTKGGTGAVLAELSEGMGYKIEKAKDIPEADMEKACLILDGITELAGGAK